MTSSKNNGALGRVESKLSAALQSGQFYEAQQLYRTLYFRLLGQSKFSEIFSLLNDGVEKLLAADQFPLAADLSLLFIDALTKSCTKVIVLPFLYIN